MYRVYKPPRKPVDFGPGFRNYAEMSGVSGYFVDHCNELINNLSLEDVNNFKNTYDDPSRIRYLYKFAAEVPLLPPDSGKDLEAAEYEKKYGNDRFSERKMDSAALAYTSGMQQCPINTPESRALFSVLLANRSAAYYESRNYKRSIFDIDYLLRIGNYPEHLLFKVWLRKAKCLDAMRSEEPETIFAFQKAQECLKFCKMTSEIVEVKNQEIEAAITFVQSRGPSWDLPEIPAVVPTYIPNEQYPGVSAAVEFEEDANQGRYAKAVQDIAAGEIIAMEKPHCTAIAPEYGLTNCLYCSLSCDSAIVCENCAYAVFCSWECKESAHAFHRWECPLGSSLYKSGASINCVMALRIITQKEISDFTHRTFPEADPRTKAQFLSTDYDTVYTLCNHAQMRKREQFLHYTFMAIFLLRLLKSTNYFGYETHDDFLSDEEIKIGSLILRHLQALQFNAHEIAELQYIPAVEFETADTAINAFKTVTVGGGLYPTLALFNHSCDPSVIRYNKGNVMIVRAIKAIRTGEIVYENYGPIFTTHELHERREVLLERYWFSCFCVACTEQWPVFENLDSSMLRFACTKCGGGHWVHKETDSPIFVCSIAQCEETNNILANLLGLSNLSTICYDAEKYYMDKLYEEAIVKYSEALGLYNKHLMSPCPDVIQIQQRMRNCCVHLGNRAEGDL